MSEAVEAHEHLEHAEHARAPSDKKVDATMAIIAAALPVVSVLGRLAATEELLGQQRASEQWSFYKGKTIRRYESEIARDVHPDLVDETFSGASIRLWSIYGAERFPFTSETPAQSCTG